MSLLETIATNLIRLAVDIVGAEVAKRILSEEEVAWANRIADRMADQKFGKKEE